MRVSALVLQIAPILVEVSPGPQSVMQRQEKLAQFRATLSEQMIDDHEEMGDAASGLLAGKTHKFLTPEGDLTDVFKT